MGQPGRLPASQRLGGSGAERRAAWMRTAADIGCGCDADAGCGAGVASSADARRDGTCARIASCGAGSACAKRVKKRVVKKPKKKYRKACRRLRLRSGCRLLGDSAVDFFSLFWIFLI
jgi:hypothetical protein